MAESIGDGTPTSRFYCHLCSVEIQRLLPDYKCPRCEGGFIEELEYANNDSGSGMDIGNDGLNDIDVDMSRYDFPQQYATAGDYFSDMLTVLARLNQPYVRLEQSPINRDNFIASNGTYPVDTILRLRRRPRIPRNYIRLALGDPDDYILDRDRLDAFVTNLLSHMDGAGPPPLPRKEIDEIPTTTVTQSHVDCKLQCSVCWEDFKVSEPVRQLPCQHLYHAPCIVPWLELHGTCPICRQSLGTQSTAEANQDTVGPNLAAFFRAADASNSDRAPSTTSSAPSASSASSVSSAPSTSPALTISSTQSTSSAPSTSPAQSTSPAASMVSVLTMSLLQSLPSMLTTPSSSVSSSSSSSSSSSTSSSSFCE